MHKSSHNQQLWDLNVLVNDVMISKFSHLLVLHIAHFLQQTFNELRHSISVKYTKMLDYEVEPQRSVLSDKSLGLL